MRIIHTRSKTMPTGMQGLITHICGVTYLHNLIVNRICIIKEPNNWRRGRFEMVTIGSI